MTKLGGRIKRLRDKIAQQNVERGTYFDSAYETVGDPERSPMGGDFGGSPVGPSRPPTIFDDERLDRRQYMRRDVSLSVVSKDYAPESNASVHFTSQEVAPGNSGEGAVYLF